MTVPGALALGAVSGLAAAAACVGAGQWLATPALGGIALALVMLTGVAVVGRFGVGGDDVLTVAAAGWWFIGAVLAAVAASPLLPWGSSPQMSTAELGWGAGLDVGVAAAAGAASRMDGLRT